MLIKVKDKKAPGQKDPMAIFKRIVVKAFNAEGIRDLEEMNHILEFAVGSQYSYLPPQQWGSQIMLRHPEIQFPPFVPIIIVMRAVIRLYKKQRRVY